MKQHISFNQFEELSEETQNKLLALIGRKDLTRIRFGTEFELFTIGKLIEIIRCKCSLVSIYNDESENRDYGWWVVECGETPEYSKEYKNIELSSALLEAVKEVL